ncbi:MAG TPA: hypothetical protein VFK26_07140 [Gemmatimonadaceae bacterium]|jgi:hypothetical protein|nr:hypothetical protein [Gemmatimonadaceae bacterium]
MPETTTDVRADIEQTKERMSSAITELERKVDLTRQIREHPWAAVGIAIGAGIALSASSADVRSARVTSDATRKTGSKLGVALDGIVASLLTGVTAAIHERIDGAVNEVASSIRGRPSPRSDLGSMRSTEAPEMPVRAD